MKTSYLFALFFVFSACGHLVKPQASSKTDITMQSGLSAYGTVLKHFVNKKGQVDFIALSKNRKDLLHFIGLIKVIPIDSFQDKNEKLAYLINAYNALSMYMVLEKNIPADNDGFFKRLNFFYYPEFDVGNKRLSLYSLENEVIRPLGDERVHFALNCMAVSCPRLPQVLFKSETLDQQLDAAATEFFAKKQNFKVENSNNTIFLSEILDFYTEDFINADTTSLLQYAQKWVQEDIPQNYKVEFIDYDWRTNDSQRIQ